MLKKIRDRYEQWKTDNYIDDSDVILVAVGSAVLLSITGLAIKAANDEYKHAKANEQWAADEIADGRQVFQLHDGSLISTDRAQIRF